MAVFSVLTATKADCGVCVCAWITSAAILIQLIDFFNILSFLFLLKDKADGLRCGQDIKRE